MQLLCANLKKAFADTVLFEDVSFSVAGRDKVGFIGVNGAGKSTLFKILAGQLDPDDGTISKTRDLQLGYLEQHPVADGDVTLLDDVLTAFSDVMAMEDELAALHAALEQKGAAQDNAARTDPETDKLIRRQAALQEQFLAAGGTHYRARARSALTGLGFSDAELSAPVARLSGGQRTRVALCKVLLSNANLLLLDEPTNHLDMDAVEWLENFLLNYSGAFLVISHDRFFLDRVTNRTFALENRHFRCYSGNYSAYLTQRENERKTEQRRFDVTTREIHRLEAVAEQQWRWKHKKNKKTHTLDHTKKTIERLEASLVEPDRDAPAVRFRFRAAPGGTAHVLQVENLAMSFGEKPLFEHVDFELKKGEKVFLLGSNGCGKTTLLRILLGQLAPTAGRVTLGAHLQVGYSDQMKETLHREKTVLDEVWDDYPALTQTEIRNALAAFLFRGDDVFQEIGSLSGGELARVELTKLLLRQVHFLVLDEPTNHLDIASREALEAALLDYDGTVLLVSHDRYFINKLADRLLCLTPSGVTDFRGNYDDYLADRQQKAAAQAAAPAPETPPSPRPKGGDYEARKRANAARRKLQTRHAKVEARIAEAEQQLAALAAQTEDPATAADYVKLSEIAAQSEALQTDLDALLTEWETLQQAIDEAET